MEIIAIEGALTDFEVKELIESETYVNLHSFEVYDREHRKTINLHRDSSAALKQHYTGLQKVYQRLQAKEITEREFKQQSLRSLDIMRGDLGRSQTLGLALEHHSRIEATLWIKHKIELYMNVHPGGTQTQNVISTFINSLKAFMLRTGSIITNTEVLMLINLRPTNVTLLSLIIANLYDRFNQQTHQNELLDIVSLLPDAPIVPTAYDDDDEDNDEDDEYDTNIQQQTNTAANNDDDDDDDDDDDHQVAILGAETAAQAAQNQDFEITGKYQNDQDETNYGDDDE